MKEEMKRVENWKRLKQEQFGQTKGASANHLKPEVTLLLRKQAREGYARTIFHQRQSHGHISISKIMSVQKIRAKKLKENGKKAMRVDSQPDTRSRENVQNMGIWELGLKITEFVQRPFSAPVSTPSG